MWRKEKRSRDCLTPYAGDLVLYGKPEEDLRMMTEYFVEVFKRKGFESDCRYKQGDGGRRRRTVALRGHCG